MTDELKQHVDIALEEIGLIQPWWSDADQMFMFEHPAYPWVMHADPNPEATKAGYIRALTGWIQDRLANNVADFAETTTTGRGGLRQGAGRPKLKVPTRTIRLPEPIVNWLKYPENRQKVERLMQDEVS
jgi:hypothetical protein